MIINALLQEKARIAKVMFALRHLDKIVKHENGKEKRVPNVMTQSKIANKMNLTFQQIQKYEKAANRIPLIKLIIVADYLDKPISYFINEKELVSQVKPLTDSSEVAPELNPELN